MNLLQLFVIGIIEQLFRANIPVNKHFCYKTFCTCYENGLAVCSSRSLEYVPRFPNFVREVSMINTRLNLISENTLYNLTFNKIEKLKFDANSVESVSKNAFRFLKQLTTFEISEQPQLTSDNLKDSFTSLQSSVQYLYFTANRWAFLPDKMFVGLKGNHIKALHLTGNQFRNLDCTIFQPFDRLERLHLANNKIEHIVLKEFGTLLKLELKNNFLDIIPSFCVSSNNSSSLLPNVRTLDISNNYITTFQKHAFECLPKVKVLILDRVNVNILPNNIFNNMKWLRHLSLNSVGNPKLKVIEDYAFNSSTLETIHMQNCRFKFFIGMCNPETIFSLCPKLMNLELINNRFSQNDKFLQKLFRPLSNLRWLSLSSTKLSKLPLQVFSYMKALNHLNLAGNRITGWQYPVDIFGNKSTIHILDLSQNLISVVNESTFPHYLRENLQKINLGNNPFVCTCDQRWFLHWIKESNVTFLNYPLSFKCAHPPEKTGTILANFYPTDDICIPWNPLYTMAIILLSFFALFILLGAIAGKCQTNLKNYIYLIRLNYNRRQGYLPILNSDDFEYHAFVVYCDADRMWVHSELLREIESNNGFRLCIHHRNFEVGQTITCNVDNFLTKAWKVIVVMSNDFAMSEWCQWEVDVIQERRRKHGKDGVILVMLANIDSKHMTSPLRTLLDGTPYLRYQRGVGEFLFSNALVETLNKPIGHPPVAVV
ncbi:toll-like receptor 13 [Mytilus californianus]|uniref:toll-like receptor 13 n=1 Tax=Mytilus californianus TaxID=6549 RepID=UPI00224727F3|nr:toll-like receptor 13 [Mytilus californianus]